MNAHMAESWKQVVTEAAVMTKDGMIYIKLAEKYGMAIV